MPASVMRKAAHLPAFLAATVLVAGCVPVQRRLASGLDAVVVDARSGQPVSGARVSVRSDSKSGGEPQDAATGPNGAFRIAPQVRTDWIPLLPYTLPRWAGVMTVTATGYRPLEQAIPMQGTEWGDLWSPVRRFELEPEAAATTD